MQVHKDKNGRKMSLPFLFPYFLTETGAGAEQPEAKTVAGYTVIRERVNTMGK
jgi:hypothetical protein